MQKALEANCAASYFRSWVGMPIKWRGISRRPIPDNWHSIGVRSSPYHLAGNRNAAHPVNAILNYAYAALESEIRIKAISEGYDPTIGIMHEGSDGSSKFMFDLMEPERPKIDRRGVGFRQGACFRSGRFCYSRRRCLPAQSGNGAPGSGEGVDMESFGAVARSTKRAVPMMRISRFSHYAKQREERRVLRAKSRRYSVRVKTGY